MNNLSADFASSVLKRRSFSGKWPPWVAMLAVLAGIVGLGYAIAQFPLVALLAVALAVVVLAVPFVEWLAVLAFWLLPYLLLNVSVGGLTLKAPEMTAYLFMAATLVRALLRHERVTAPPATFPVLIFLLVLAISAAVSPLVPSTNWGSFSGILAPGVRSFGLLFWLILSWLLVVSLYHVIGQNSQLYRRCVCAHIWSGTLASLIGIVAYVSALCGGKWVLAAIGSHRGMIFSGGGTYRLTGVSYEPLLFAFYLMTVIPVALTVAFYKPDWMPRPVVLGSVFLLSLALLLTFSAGGWIALAAGLLLMVCLFRPQRINLARLLPFLLPALLPIVLCCVLYSANSRVTNVVNSTVEKITTGGYKMRDDENLTGMRIFESHPLLGVGPSMTPFYFPIYHPTTRTMDNDTISYFVNNLYITTLAESGILGFIALALCGIFGLAALCGPVMRWGPKQVPVLTGLTIALIGCAIQYWNTQNLFLIYFPALIGLACAGARLASAQPEQTLSSLPPVKGNNT